MRALAIYGPMATDGQLLDPSVETAAIGGVSVRCGLREVDPPPFDGAAPESARQVLVRVRAFSCNYRDKALILRAATRAPAGAFYVIGSEFVAEVAGAGAGVTRFRVGDRVIGDNCWPGPPGAERRGGIPTNHASRERLVLCEDKLTGVPPSMPDPVAAAFSVGAQTAYSMIERLGAGRGTSVLVTAARSNTSLFAIRALGARGAKVYATTTSEWSERERAAFPVEMLFRVDPGVTDFREHGALKAVAAELGGFECVFDPFFDLHLRKVLPIMAFGGRYATCGLYDQYLSLTASPFPGPRPDYVEALQIALVRNVQLIGNCLGRTGHLERAIADYAAGALPVVVDSVFTGTSAAAFLERTYNARDRFGKVVFAYD